MPKSTEENKQPNASATKVQSSESKLKSGAKKLSTKKQPSIVPRETKSSQLLKRKNQGGDKPGNTSALNSSNFVTPSKRKPVKARVFEVQDQTKQPKVAKLSEKEVRLENPPATGMNKIEAKLFKQQNQSAQKAPSVQNSALNQRRQTTKPNYNPYEANY